MVEPTTVNRALIVPNTGDLPGLWGSAALNPDLVSIDGMFGGVTTVSLTNANVVLSVPAGYVATPSAGPTQSQSAVIRFTGALTGNCQITFPMPGIYIAENLTTGAFVVTLFTGVGGGKVVALPPGEAVDVYNDGTDFKFRNLGRIGSYMDLGTSTIPAWITACTVPPYLNCDGTTFSAITYPVLNSLLGGNTLPDLRGRSRAALNQGTGRISASGVNGNVILSAGGADTQVIAKANLPAYNLTITEPNGGLGHLHSVPGAPNLNAAGLSEGAAVWNAASNTNTTFSTTGITVSTGGSGTALTTLPPVAVGGLTFIRAG